MNPDAKYVGAPWVDAISTVTESLADGGAGGVQLEPPSEALPASPEDPPDEPDELLPDDPDDAPPVIPEEPPVGAPPLEAPLDEPAPEPDPASTEGPPRSGLPPASGVPGPPLAPLSA